MTLERGIIRHIDARGRVTVELGDRLVVADIHSGSGGCIGDIVEGDMRPGVRSWRNVGTSVLSVVEVIRSEALPAPARVSGTQSPEPKPRRRAVDVPGSRPDERWPLDRRDAPGDQYSNRTLNWN